LLTYLLTALPHTLSWILGVLLLRGGKERGREGEGRGRGRGKREGRGREGGRGTEGKGKTLCICSPPAKKILATPLLHLTHRHDHSLLPAFQVCHQQYADDTSVIFVNQNENENEKDQQFVHENEN